MDKLKKIGGDNFRSYYDKLIIRSENDRLLKPKDI